VQTRSPQWGEEMIKGKSEILKQVQNDPTSLKASDDKKNYKSPLTPLFLRGIKKTDVKNEIIRHFVPQNDNIKTNPP